MMRYCTRCTSFQLHHGTTIRVRSSNYKMEKWHSHERMNGGGNHLSCFTVGTWHVGMYTNRILRFVLKERFESILFEFLELLLAHQCDCRPFIPRIAHNATANFSIKLLRANKILIIPCDTPSIQHTQQ